MSLVMQTVQQALIAKLTGDAVLERLQGLLHHGSLTMSAHTLREMRVEGASCVLAEQATRVVGSMELSLIISVD